MAPTSKGGKSRNATDKPAKGAPRPSPSLRPRPDWPAMKPLMPASDLSFETLLEDQILTIPRLWTSSLCKTYVNFLSTLPLSTTPGKPKKGEAVRVNDRFQIEDADFAARLWNDTALRDLVMSHGTDDAEFLPPHCGGNPPSLWGSEVLGLNANIRIYRYSKGQFFDQHYDDSNNIMFPSSDSPDAVPAKTTWTLLLYLTAPSTGCQGGATVFYLDAPKKNKGAAPPAIVAEPEIGMALLHRHGRDCLLHEGQEVLEGEKWVIRSDLCVRR